MLELIRKADGLLGRLPESAALLMARIAAGHVFWAAGETRRAEGTLFGLAEGQIDLFRDEFHMPFPELMAPVTMGMEHLLPVLLVLGLFGRFAALGMAVMTLVIQLFVYPDAWWTEHSLWLGLLVVLIARGPGGWSLDLWLIGSAGR